MTTKRNKTTTTTKTATRRGRPPVYPDGTVRVQTRITPELAAELAVRSMETGVPQTRIIADAIWIAMRDYRLEFGSPEPE